jgi:NAD(P)-dependent dehydrogenase (short-subunit alcohol dehydrogenase family)
MKKICIIGASRGLGLGLVERFLEGGFEVWATQRQPSSALEALRHRHAALHLASLDINQRHEIAAFAESLQGVRFDVLFVNAGVSSKSEGPLAAIEDAEISRVFFTNAVAPLRVAEALLGHVEPGGTIGFMTSVLGSIARCEGGIELYRVSKAALNMAAVCFAKRPENRARTLLLLHPGWVRTDMGGPNAPLDVETSTRGLYRVITERHGQGGLAYLDYQGEPIPW